MVPSLLYVSGSTNGLTVISIVGLLCQMQLSDYKCVRDRATADVIMAELPNQNKCVTIFIETDATTHKNTMELLQIYNTVQLILTLINTAVQSKYSKLTQ